MMFQRRLQVRDIRNEGRDLKDEFTKRLQQSSEEVNRFSEDMLTNLAILDGLFRTGEELAEKSSDAEVIRDYKQLKQELTDGVQDKAMEQKVNMERAFLRRGKIIEFSRFETSICDAPLSFELFLPL